MPRRFFLALTAATLAVAAMARPATLRLSFADSADPNPRRVEIGAQMLGLGLALVLSWTHHGPVSE